MRTIKSGLLWLMLLVSPGLFLTSCKDDETAEETGRLFKPYDLSISPHENGFIIRWNLSYGAKAYEVDLSLNGNFDPIAKTVVFPTTGERRYEETVGNLEENTKYYVRLRAVIEGEPSLSSRYVYTEGTTGVLPSVFYVPGFEDMTYSEATLRWKEDTGATQLTVTSEGTESVVRDLTAEEIAAMEATVENLEEGRTYKASFYVEGVLKSSVSFTMPVKPDGAIEITNENDLKAAIEGAAEGAVLLLKGGQVYDYSSETIELTRSITLMAAPGAPKPVVYVKEFAVGGINPATVVVPELKFEGIEFSGMVYDGTAEQPMERPGDKLFSFYVTKVKGGDITAGSITLRNCVARNYAQAFAGGDYNLADAAAKLRIGDITVDDCILYDFGRYAGDYTLINIQAGSSRNNSQITGVVTFRNSTLHHLQTGLLEHRYKDCVTDAVCPAGVVLENCTIDAIGALYETEPGSGIYDRWYHTENTKISQRNFMNFTGYAAAVGKPVPVTITNCIIGEVLNVPNGEFPGGRGCASYISGSADVALSNQVLYTTTDCAIASKVTGSSSAGADSYAVFPDKKNGNYTISENAMLPAEVGDPRWRAN